MFNQAVLKSEKRFNQMGKKMKKFTYAMLGAVLLLQRHEVGHLYMATESYYLVAYGMLESEHSCPAPVSAMMRVLPIFLAMRI